MWRWSERGFDYIGGAEKDSKSFSLINSVKEFAKSHKNLIPSPLWDALGDTYKNLFKAKNAKEVTDRTVNFIRQTVGEDDEPFFIYSHYWDVHFPYEAPDWQKFYEKKQSERSLDRVIDEIKEEFEGRSDWLRERKDLGEVLARYDAAIAHVDSQIDRIIRALKKEKIFDDTLIIITSDHGESLLEHGIYLAHEGLFDEVIHVPLILHWPKRLPKGERIKGIVQHPDLVPSILDLLGIESSFDFDGESLLPLIRGEKEKLHDEAYLQDRGWRMGIRTADYKYITDYPLEETEYEPKFKNRSDLDCEDQLYDLSEDPEEKTNLADTRKEKAQQFRQEIYELLNQFQEKAERKEKKDIQKKIQKLKLSGEI